MAFQGHALGSVEGFPNDLVRKLGQELSIHTAEQFVDVTRRNETAIAALLRIDAKHLRELCERAVTVIAPEDLDEILRPPKSDYPFATGHDAPVDKKKVYKGESSDD